MARACFKEKRDRGGKGNIYVEGKIEKGRPKKRWGNVIENNMRWAGVSCEKGARNRALWKLRTMVADPK